MLRRRWHAVLKGMWNRTNLRVVRFRNSRCEDLYRNVPFAAEELEVRHLLNGLPIANPDSVYQTAINTQLSVNAASGVLTNDFDAEGSGLTATQMSGPSYGTLNSFNSDGSFVYTPNSGFQGIDFFTYRTSDGTGNSATVRANVVVGQGFSARQNLDERIGDNPLHTGALSLSQPLSAGLNLVYGSNTVVRPIVAVDAFLSAASTIPNSITATLTFGGVAGSAVTYTTTGMTTGTMYRFAVQAASAVSSLATGMYDWSLELVANYTGSTLTRIYTSQQAFVNRSTSDYGSGWWLSGLDRLHVSSAGGLLVKPNAATYWYAYNGSNYDPAVGDPSYSTLTTISGGFRLTDKWGNESDFNSNGYLTSYKLKNNSVASYTYTYNGSNQLTTITDEFSRTYTVAYTSGKVSSITDFASDYSTLTISSGNLTAVTAATPASSISGYTAPQWQYGYTSGLITSVTPPGSSATTFAFDSFNLLSTVTNPGGSLRTYHATAGQGARADGGSGAIVALSAIDARLVNELSHTVHFTTDGFGNLIRLQDHLGAISTFEYSTNSEAFRITAADPDGAGPLLSPVTKLGYNASGDLMFVKFPDNTTNTATYQSTLHHLLTSTDVFGTVTTFTYDSSGNLLTKVVGDGDPWVYTYNTHGNVLTETSPDPDDTGPLTTIVTSFEYETTIYNRLKKVTYADNSTRQYTYDSRENVATSTDELGHVTSYVWDPLARTTQVTLPDPDGAGSKTSPVYTYEYETNTLLKKATDALGNYTQYTYNNRNWVATVVPMDPDGTGSLASPTVTYGYDNLGRVTSVTAPIYSSPVTYAYDSNGQVTSVSGPVSGQTSSFTYDLLGRNISSTDASGRTKTFEYDIASRLTRFEDHDPDGAGPKDGPVTLYGYDIGGHMTTVTDPLGRVTTMAYLVTGPLTSVTLPDPDWSGPLTSSKYSYSYDALGRQYLTTDPNGRETKLEYNKRNRVTKLTTPNPNGGKFGGGTETTYAYDSAGNLLTKTEPLARVTSYAYDNLDRLITETLPDPDGTGSQTSPVWSYDYDAVSNLTSLTNPLGLSTTYAYDKLYRQTQITLPDPDGAGSQTSPVWNYAFASHTQISTMTDPMSRVTTYAYDVAGRTAVVTDPLGFVTTFGYDLMDRLTSTTTPDPDGAGALTASTTQFGYDIYSRPVTITDGLNGATTKSYDAAGQLLSLSDPTGNVTRWSYDRAGQMVMETNALADSRSFEFDASGFLTNSIDRNAKITKYAFDGESRLTSEKWYSQTNVPYLSIATTQAGSSTTEEIQTVTAYNVDYETEGTFRLALNGETTKAIAVTAAAATVESALEEMGGIDNVVVTKSGNTWTIRFTGNLSNTDVSLMQGDAKLTANGTLLQTMTFGYDAAARVTSASDPAATYAYTFDKLDRITGETQTIASLTPKIQLDRTFSALGSVLTLAADFVQNNQVVADDFINTYTYNGLNQMISVVQDNQTGGSANAVADKRVELKYNALGQFTSIERNQNTSATYPSLRTAFTYDAGNRLSSIAHRNYTDASTSTLLSDYAFTHDNTSRITAINSSLDGNSAIAYDKTHQVTAADHAAGRTDESYSYDANGNRTNSGYTTTTNNRTTSDGTYNYLYDKEGNRTRRTLISDGSYEQYTWDHRNRLTKVEFKTSAGALTKSVTYSYDIFNRLVRRQLDPDGSGSQPATNIFYAGYDGITPTLEFDGTTKDDVSHRYLWGSAYDQLFADEQVSVPTSNGNVLWPLADHLGTIRDIADYNEASPAFSITNHRVYDTFGRLESETNSAVDLSFGYTGKQFDDATSLNNYLNRWYDPRLGKWLSEDPLGFSAGDANLSRYVGNTPTLFTDPLGLAAFDESGAAVTTSRGKDNIPVESKGKISIGDDATVLDKRIKGAIVSSGGSSEPGEEYWGPMVWLWLGRWSAPKVYWDDVFSDGSEEIGNAYSSNIARSALRYGGTVDPTGVLSGPEAFLTRVESGGSVIDGLVDVAVDIVNPIPKGVGKVLPNTPRPKIDADDVCGIAKASKVRKVGDGGCFVSGTLVHVSALPDLQRANYLIADRAIGLLNARRVEADTATFGDAIGLQDLPHAHAIPIEDIPLGSRVEAFNPIRDDYDYSFPSPDVGEWVRIRLTIVRRHGSPVEAELLRPIWWTANLPVGVSIPVRWGEGEFDGFATLKSIEPAGPLAEGDGEVVTGRFRIQSADSIVRVTIAGGVVLEGTSVHPIWLENRHKFVPLGEIQPGDIVNTLDGPRTVIRAELTHYPATVYNLEIQGEHVYRVSPVGILVHNPDPCPGIPTEVFRGGSKTKRNFTPKPKDGDGLSTFDTPEAAIGKNPQVQVIDTSGLEPFDLIPDGTGHIAIRPKDPTHLSQWVDNTEHEFTQQVMDAIVREIRRSELGL